MATDDEIERIARRLIDTTLPKGEWTHRAHFAAAIWLLTHPDELARRGGIAPLIRRYNEVTGVANTDTGGFHASITEASLRGAAVHLAEYPENSLSHVLDLIMTSELGSSRWPLAYWSEKRLMSVEARRGWVVPDRVALPWPPLAKKNDTA